MTTNIEKGLSMADRASNADLKAIDIGERGAKAFKSGNECGLKSAASEAKGWYKSKKVFRQHQVKTLPKDADTRIRT